MKLVLLLFLVGSICHAEAQQYLVLKKRSKVIQTYSSGDQIQFRLKGEKSNRTGIITEIGDTSVYINKGQIMLKSISRIYLPQRENFHVSLLSEFLVTAGVLFFLIEQTNQVVVRGERFAVAKETIVASTGLVIAGIALPQLVKQKFNLNKTKYWLHTSDYDYGRD